MSSTVEQYKASLDRLNVIAAEGHLDRLAVISAYRLELKTLLRLHRRLIAEEVDQDIRRLRQQQLHALKRIHWNARQIEQAAMVRVSLEN